MSFRHANREQLGPAGPEMLGPGPPVQEPIPQHGGAVDEAVVEPPPPGAVHELPDVRAPCPSLPAEKAPTTPEEMLGWDLVDDVGASVPILVEPASSSSAF